MQKVHDVMHLSFDLSSNLVIYYQSSIDCLNPLMNYFVVVGTRRELLPSAKTKVRIIEGGLNNLPDDNSHRASNEIVSLLSSLTEDDLVLALISGKNKTFSTIEK